MTVREAINSLEELIKGGMNENSILQAWDIDADEDMPVRGFLYNGTTHCTVQTDSDEENDLMIDEIDEDDPDFIIDDPLDRDSK